MGSIKASMRFVPQEVKIYRPNKNRISTTLLNCIDRSTIGAQKFFIRVADFDDAEVGFYMLYCQSSNIYVLHALAVKEHLRGRGLGSWLLGHAIGLTESKGGRQLLSYSLESKDFLRSKGFASDENFLRYTFLPE